MKIAVIGSGNMAAHWFAALWQVELLPHKILFAPQQLRRVWKNCSQGALALK